MPARILHAARSLSGSGRSQTSYRSASGALGTHFIGPRSTSVGRTKTSEHDVRSAPLVAARAAERARRSGTPCRSTARSLRPTAQQPQRRQALRENTPPWAVRLEHRFFGKLINVSRRGLAIETREAPPFYARGRLRVDVSGEPVDLEVAVQWCRLVGIEEIETDRGVETAPRFQLGLGCDDPALRRLGAPPACSTV